MNSMVVEKMSLVADLIDILSPPDHMKVHVDLHRIPKFFHAVNSSVKNRFVSSRQDRACQEKSADMVEDSSGSRVESIRSWSTYFRTAEFR